MKFIPKILFLLFALFAGKKLIAQNNFTARAKVAVFAPVYLDSAFNTEGYKLGKNNLPKYLVPGLEFYNGVMLAIDSLNAEKAPVEVLFYDTKNINSSLSQITGSKEFQDVGLVIGAFTTAEEMKPLADWAFNKNIPLISATFPNDGGIGSNPFFAMANPTLVTHLESIYRFVHRSYPTNNITVFTRKGNVEDLIRFTFNDLNKKTPGIPLKLKTVELPDSLSTDQLSSYLDSTKQNILICGSLQEGFGTSLAKALGSLKNYHTITIGMPTWDGLKDISKDIEIVYTTPYNFNRTEKSGLQLTENCKNKFSGRASDMVFKGYEAMYHFTKLLLKNGRLLINHLSDKDFKLFNDFDFQPVRSNKASALPDYLENKKLYFIRKQDGKIISVK